MTPTRIVFLALGLVCFSSPALAGFFTPWNHPPAPWACAAFEFNHRCNALWHPHSRQCRCYGMDDMGWRLNEYYGPKAPNQTPLEVTQ
jgi:hypothetical protein